MAELNVPLEKRKYKDEPHMRFISDHIFMPRKKSHAASEEIRQKVEYDIVRIFLEQFPQSQPNLHLMVENFVRFVQWPPSVEEIDETARNARLCSRRSSDGSQLRSSFHQFRK